MEELDLSQIEIGTITEDIRKQLDKYKNVTTLLLQDCSLTTLDNLPNFKLNVIEVSENKYHHSLSQTQRLSHRHPGLLRLPPPNNLRQQSDIVLGSVKTPHKVKKSIRTRPFWQPRRLQRKLPLLALRKH